MKKEQAAQLLLLNHCAVSAMNRAEYTESERERVTTNKSKKNVYKITLMVSGEFMEFDIVV